MGTGLGVATTIGEGGDVAAVGAGLSEGAFLRSPMRCSLTLLRRAGRLYPPSNTDTILPPQFRSATASSRSVINA